MIHPGGDGGLRLSGVMSPAPLTDGPDVSWIGRVLSGDDQGQDGACALFALASWAEIMYGQRIPDQARLELYRLVCRELHRDPGAGLTFPEAYRAASAAGWLPGTSRIDECIDLASLAIQPLVAGYAVTGALDHVSPWGCLDHAAPGHPIRGYHALTIVACGHVRGIAGGPWVYVENSWGVGWGWRGLGVLSYALHSRLVREIWRIV